MDRRYELPTAGPTNPIRQRTPPLHRGRKRRHRKHEAERQHAKDSRGLRAQLVDHCEEHDLDWRPNDCHDFGRPPERVLGGAR